jgi:peptidoglycan hydrolase-like protein with peptidoglycan-binding domain
VQQYLNQALNTKPDFVTDGIFGAKSAAKTQQCQRDKQLIADGIVGPNTWAQLIALLENLLSVPPR